MLMSHASSGTRVAVVINPISGIGARPDAARRRAEEAAANVERHGLDADILVTERGGHARELTQGAIARGASVVVAWGGDGTVNEVASVLAFRPDVALGIVPSGSGNGLARELGLPFEARAAFDVALGGGGRRIDAGEIEGRLFFNVAGVGVDAFVAHRFAEHGARRRGFARYLTVSSRALLSYEPVEGVVNVDGAHYAVRPLLVALANARQYGNGAIIAPAARLDDGHIDVVIVDYRSPLAVLRHVPALFGGRLAEVPGVAMHAARSVEMSFAVPVCYHVDGEPFTGGRMVSAVVRPGALQVCV